MQECFTSAWPIIDAVILQTGPHISLQEHCMVWPRSPNNPETQSCMCEGEPIDGDARAAPTDLTSQSIPFRLSTLIVQSISV